MKRLQCEKQQEEAKQIKATRRIAIEGLPYCIICDIDGTLALRGDRSPFNYNDAGKDEVNLPVAAVVNLMHVKYKIILVTGRERWAEKITEDWLRTNNIPYDAIFYRDTDDHRPDDIVKKEIYTREISQKYNVEFAIEDRKRVKKLWVENGIFVFDVNQTDLDF
jgi:hypothetical protein